MKKIITILSFLLIAMWLPALAQQRTFKGYICTQDCSGHIAGYNWAARKGINDPAQCSGNSQSFYEGCVAYASGR